MRALAESADRCFIIGLRHKHTMFLQMSDTIAMLRMIIARSPRNASGAASALRWLAAGPDTAPPLGVARAARAALCDTDAEWTDDERARLAAAATADQDTDTDNTDDASDLSRVLTSSGLSIVEFARVVGRDERTVRRWLSREMPIPGAVSAMLARVQRIDATTKKITITLER